MRSSEVWNEPADDTAADGSAVEPGLRRATGIEYVPITVDEGFAGSIRAGSALEFAAGEVLFGPGDVLTGAYRVIAGRVELVLEGRKDRELVLVSAGPGALVGEDYVLNEAPSLVWAVAATDVLAVLYDRAALVNGICGDPALTESLLMSLARKLETFTIRLHNVTFMNLECRVAKLLLAGAQLDQNLGTMTSITHSEIARCTGSCRVAVTRTLRGMEKAGLVVLRRGCIQLMDSERLGRLACLVDD